MDIQTIVNISLLTLLAITAIILLRLQNLLAAVLLSGIYTLLSAGLFVSLDAVDVAFTEAAVGAGLRRERPAKHDRGAAGAAARRARRP